MGQHVAYWTTLAQQGTALAFGPVADPRGAWGLGIIQVARPEQVAELQAGDPVIQAGTGFSYEAVPMPTVVIRP
ncbi:MAG TPA: YciI family protein [Candidatus Xenobia bacterium]